MAEVTLTLRFNRVTGQREIVVGYEGESDALPHEHERDHRALVESLLGRALGDDTAVVVRRVRKDGTVIDEGDDNPAREGQRQAR
jgi:hypothetical protein